jgi:N-acetylglutamate synthase-like GNAT family acetyltransferase
MRLSALRRVWLSIRWEWRSSVASPSIRRSREKGLGVTLLQDALRRIETAADEIGIRAVFVQAIDEQARQFYREFGFSPSPIDDMRLMLLMKDLRAFLRSSGSS